MRKTAMFWEAVEAGGVRCGLCCHRCLIPRGASGTCRVRRNIDGVLYSCAYGKIAASAVDPVEKKPLYHFLPGSRTFSIATLGCNFRCDFCQNAHLSQPERFSFTGRAVPPSEIVEEALASGSASISYTYSEPTVFFEYAWETGRMAREAGLKNIFVTNGFMAPEVHVRLGEFLDAANVDLKAFSDDTYRQVLGGRLGPVLDNISRLRGAGIHVEVSTLLVPRMNDTDEELAGIARFLASVDPGMPWHVLAFHPDHRMTDRGPTDPADVLRAADIGRREGLRFVYAGNLPGNGRAR